MDCRWADRQSVKVSQFTPSTYLPTSYVCTAVVALPYIGYICVKVDTDACKHILEDRRPVDLEERTRTSGKQLYTVYLDSGRG